MRTITLSDREASLLEALLVVETNRLDDDADYLRSRSYEIGHEESVGYEAYAQAQRVEAFEREHRALIRQLREAPHHD